MSVNDMVAAMESKSINIDIMQIIQQDTIAAQHKWTAEQEPMFCTSTRGCEGVENRVWISVNYK